jgi:hypothetical protein
VIIADTFKNVLASSGYRSIVKDERYHNPWFGRFPNREVLDLCGVYSADQFSNVDIRVCVRGILELVESRFRRYQFDRYSDLKALRPSATKDVKRTVARLVFCSLRKIPNQRLDIALQYYRASGNGQVYHWLGTTAGNKTKFPCDVFVHIVAPISSPADAATKSVDLKRIIKRSAQIGGANFLAAPNVSL